MRTVGGKGCKVFIRNENHWPHRAQPRKLKILSVYSIISPFLSDRIISSRSVLLSIVGCLPHDLFHYRPQVAAAGLSLYICKIITSVHSRVDAQTATKLIQRAEMPFNYWVSIKMHGGTIWRQYCLGVYFPTRDVCDIIHLIAALFVNNHLFSGTFKTQESVYRIFINGITWPAEENKHEIWKLVKCKVGGIKKQAD